MPARLSVRSTAENRRIFIFYVEPVLCSKIDPLPEIPLWSSLVDHADVDPVPQYGSKGFEEVAYEF